MLISYFLPPKTLTNVQLESEYASPEWTDAKIFRKTGIKARHVVDGEIVSDLAVACAEKLFSEYDIDRKTVDFIILCTQSPDYFLPPTSCIVQDRLGLPVSVGAFDFNQGCSGYIYGLAVSKGLLAAKIARRVLLITAETYTRYIHPLDRSTRTVFGDAAAATLLDFDDVAMIGEFVLGTDGKGVPNLIVPTGGGAKKPSEKTALEHIDSSGNVRSQDNIYMNGPEIFAFTLRTVPDLVGETLSKNGLSMGEIDYVVFHQANKLILDSLMEKMNIPREKYCIDVEELGNTVSSTIPIALQRAVKSGEIKSGMRVLLAGFGVGYSWGGTILKIDGGKY